MPSKRSCEACGAELVGSDADLFCPACLQKPSPEPSPAHQTVGDPIHTAWLRPSEASGDSGGQGKPSSALALRVPDHELLRRVGTGAYGEVWLARNALGTFRAVKIVQRAKFDHDRPFEREFNGIQKFEPVSRQHPGLTDILHVGRAQDCFYYVMELADDAREISGPKSAARDWDGYVPRTLAHELKCRGRLPVAECRVIARLLAEALQHLHDHGLVHRDVKPSNIVFVDGAPKLADIGLVAEFSEAQSFVGTAGYIPPQGPGTPQADLYSLGKVLYEMCTGLDRHEFPQVPQHWRELTETPELMEFNEIVLKACEAEPSRRYASAAELKADLASLEAGRSVIQRRRLASWLALARKAAFGLTLAAAIGVGLWWAIESLVRPSPPLRPGIPRNSVAVLPFRNESADPADEYLGESLAGEVLNALARVPGLKVSARHSAFAFKPDPIARPRIAERLQVRTLLEGTLRKSGDHLDLAVWLVGADPAVVLWSNRYVRPMAEVSGVPRAVAERVTQALDIQLTAASREGATSPATIHAEAYQLYLRGRYFWNKRTDAGLRTAIQQFQDAVRIDDHFPLAHVGLADAWVLLTMYGTNVVIDKALFEAQQAAARAVELDPTLGEAHTTLAFLQSTFDWDWTNAESRFKQAMDLNPAYATAHHWYAFNLLQMGRIDDGIASLQRALRFDPLSLIIQTDAALFHLHARAPKRAIQLCQEVLKMDSSFLPAQKYLIRAYELDGRYPEALQAARKLAYDSNASASAHLLLARALALNHQRAEALHLLAECGAEQSQDASAVFDSVMVLVALGDVLAAIERLERVKAMEPRIELRFLRIDPRLDPLRDHPRFQQLLQDLRLK